MPIQILQPEVAAKIAAGEVVERPANAAKELIENSLDAGATEIRVEIREGGRRLLRVTDNGHGIPADEAELAFQRHATSKLHTAEDLSHIATFGFRGEALYSIAAVSHVTLTTRHRDEPFGVQVRVEGGQIVGRGRAGSPVGTVVSVEHLFYNVPARQKFLRKAATEAGHIANLVQRYALAHPDRRFSLVNDGRLVFQSNGNGDPFDVLAKVYGLENARQMVSLLPGDGTSPPGLDVAQDVSFMAEELPGAEAAGANPEESPVRVTGYTSLPSLTRANRSHIDIFVNRRYVEDRSLVHAVVQAYHTLLPVGRYPLAVIFVEVAPELVDVNVHPQKTQVRFVEERRIFSAVQKATRQAILRHAAPPDLALPSSQPPAEDVGTRGPDSGWATRREALLGAGRQSHLDLFVPPGQPARQSSPLPVGDQTEARQENWHQPATGGSSRPVPSQQPAHLPPLRVVGQVGAMYIIAEGPEGLYLIDQHAAHERILYEKFMAQRYGQGDGGVPRQQLLQPLPLHVGSELAGLVARHLDELLHLGFEIEPFGGDTFLVRAVPSVLSGQDPQRSLDEIVSALGENRNLVGEELENRLVKMICKRAAIKGGQLLSTLEMQELVRQLEACQSPRTCPHGRPTLIQLSAGELERAFGRA